MIAEGLEDPTINNDLPVSKAFITPEDEPPDDAGATGPWHLYWVTADERAIDRLQAITRHGWYAHFWRDDQRLVVYDDARFEIHRTDTATWQAAIDHGLGQGLRREWLDFPTDDSVGTLE